MTAALRAVPESSSPDLDRLADLEQVIEQGMATFIEVGLALAEIRDRQLFRATHGTFKAYVLARWGFGQQWAYQAIYSAQVGSAIVNEHGALPPGIAADALAPLLNQKGPKAVAKAWSRCKSATDSATDRRRVPRSTRCSRKRAW